MPLFEQNLNQSFAAGLMLAASFIPRATPVQAGEPAAPAAETTLQSVLSNVDVPAQITALPLNEQQSRICLATYYSLTDKGKDLFLALAGRSNSAQESMVLNKDFRGLPLYQNLAVLSSMDFHPALERERDMIIESFLTEICDPGQLNQASWNVCATGMIYILYEQHPSEAARLLAGLVSPEGKTQLQDGSLFERAYAVLEPDKQPGRSRSEQLMMSALMERANGEKRYCDQCDEHFDPRTGAVTGSGLQAVETATLYRSLLNQNRYWLLREKNTSDTLMRNVFKGTPGYLPVALNWSTYTTRRESPRKRHTLPHETSRQESHHVTLNGIEVKEAGRIGSHFCLVTRIENGRVYYRNMHGPTEYPNGTKFRSPPRRIEDNTAGIESMTITDFKNRLNKVWVEE